MRVWNWKRRIASLDVVRIYRLIVLFSECLNILSNRKEKYNDQHVTFPFNYVKKTDGLWSCQIILEAREEIRSVFPALWGTTSLRGIWRGFNSCLFWLLRASGGCVPLNISRATWLCLREGLCDG